MQHDMPMKPYGPTAGRDHLDSRPRPKTTTVDFHIHMRITAADDLIGDRLPDDSNVQLRFADEASRKQSIKHHQERMPYLTDIDERLPDMSDMQVDVAAVSCAPKQFFYSTEPSLGHESSQVVNDGIANNIKDHKDTHIGLGTVPLQDTDLAIKEMKRCINELGFKGLQIGARVSEEEELDTTRLFPFWEAAQELDIPMLIHPSSFSSPRLAKHHMMNIIGNPLDTTVGVHYLIFGGVMERFPNLKFVLSHGGAFASHYSARMDHAYGARPDCRDKIHQKPSVYLSKFYFDTLVFSKEQLSYLISRFGSDHILLGTDYPYDMAEFDPVEHVYQIDGLSETERENICGLNALSLMKMNADYFK
ncbi:amidohydrolase family protein [Hyphomicrobiales bacterium]|jgi:aminocarboxymuconate-semialdehyde decarboxylase|nr:amidohydrolase family protein [Hyphomicrobiales bacterium]|tara:strand:+ start:2137 stop:3222 length:1086 start_codon:yes stop_codon:yes gene_type:complete